jgi:hypothetical protein
MSSNVLCILTFSFFSLCANCNPVNKKNSFFIFSCSLAGGGLLCLLHHSLLPEPEAGAQGGRLAIQQVSQPKSTEERA